MVRRRNVTRSHLIVKFEFVASEFLLDFVSHNLQYQPQLSQCTAPLNINTPNAYLRIKAYVRGQYFLPEEKSMKRPVDIVLAILCLASLIRPFSGDSNLMEIIGYLAIALLSASLIVVLHLRPNQTPEPFAMAPSSIDSRPLAKRSSTKRVKAESAA